MHNSLISLFVENSVRTSSLIHAAIALGIYILVYPVYLHITTTDGDLCRLHALLLFDRMVVAVELQCAIHGAGDTAFVYRRLVLQC